MRSWHDTPTIAPIDILFLLNAREYLGQEAMGELESNS